jgi:hypothetical protein
MNQCMASFFLTPGPELDVLKPGPKVLFFASLGKLSEQPAFVMIGKWCLDCPTT